MSKKQHSFRSIRVQLLSLTSIIIIQFHKEGFKRDRLKLARKGMEKKTNPMKQKVFEIVKKKGYSPFKEKSWNK